MTTYYVPADHTATEWREMAKDCYRREQESFERSDTDGFLSQWAANQFAKMYERMAELAANGGRANLHWLYERDNETGEWVPVENWRWVETRYGMSVLVVRESRENVFFNPSEARKASTRQRNDERKGFRWGTVETEVVCRFGGGAYNMIVTERKRNAPLTVVSTAHYSDWD